MTTSPPRPSGHGSIRLIEEHCTSCMICARECPSWCIRIDSHTEVAITAGASGRGRERSHNVLDSFTIDWGQCLFCGICIDECPFDALAWTGTPEHEATARSELQRRPQP